MARKSVRRRLAPLLAWRADTVPTESLAAPKSPAPGQAARCRLSIRPQRSAGARRAGRPPRPAHSPLRKREPAGVQGSGACRAPRRGAHTRLGAAILPRKRASRRRPRAGALRRSRAPRPRAVAPRPRTPAAAGPPARPGPAPRPDPGAGGVGARAAPAAQRRRRRQPGRRRGWKRALITPGDMSLRPPRPAAR